MKPWVVTKFIFSEQGKKKLKSWIYVEQKQFLRIGEIQYEF